MFFDDWFKQERELRHRIRYANFYLKDKDPSSKIDWSNYKPDKLYIRDIPYQIESRIKRKYVKHNEEYRELAILARKINRVSTIIGLVFVIILAFLGLFFG